MNCLDLKYDIDQIVSSKFVLIKKRPNDVSKKSIKREGYFLDSENYVKNV